MTEQIENIEEVDYDGLVEEIGVPVDENETVITDKDAIKEQIDNSNSTQRYAYGETGPIPGQSIEGHLNKISNITKETALSDLITKSAQIKAEKERKIREEAIRKERTFEVFMQQQNDAWFKEHHYQLNGQQKRRLKKIFEKEWKKGRFRNVIVDLNA